MTFKEEKISLVRASSPCLLSSCWLEAIRRKKVENVFSPFPEMRKRPSWLDVGFLPRKTSSSFRKGSSWGWHRDSEREKGVLGPDKPRYNDNSNWMTNRDGGWQNKIYFVAPKLFARFPDFAVCNVALANGSKYDSLLACLLACLSVFCLRRKEGEAIISNFLEGLCSSTGICDVAATKFRTRIWMKSFLLFLSHASARRLRKKTIKPSRTNFKTAAFYSPPERRKSFPDPDNATNELGEDVPAESDIRVFRLFIFLTWET